LVVRSDIGIKRPLVDDLAGQPLYGKAGVGFSFLSSRPLPYGQSSEPVPLLDASGGILWGPFDMRIEFYNLLNQDYAALEYSYASDWNPDDGLRSRVPARHMAAGAPLSWMLTLGLRL
jgi:hypothetical protein